MGSKKLRAKTDGFVFHARQMQRGKSDHQRVNLILHVTPRWNEPSRFKVASRIGDVVVGSCELDFVEEIAEDDNVLGIELERGSGSVR